MLRTSYILRIVVRAAAALTWLVCVVWWGFAAAGYWIGALLGTYAVVSTAPGRWQDVTGEVVTYVRNQKSTGKLVDTRDVLAYSYVFEGNQYRQSIEAREVATPNATVPASELPPLVAGVASMRQGTPIRVWVDANQPAVSRLSAPPLPHGALRSLGLAIVYSLGLILATVFARKIVFRPLPPFRDALDPDAAAKLRDMFELNIPEPADVPLPADVQVLPSRAGLGLEFPRRRISAGSVLLTALFGATFVWLGVAAKGSSGRWIAVLFGALVVWMAFAQFRGGSRRCVLEASQQGLVSRKSFLGIATRVPIARDEIDYLEPRQTDSTGPRGSVEMHFEIAAVLRSGKRVVLGENLPGIAVTDTVVRRIGAAAGLHPEQVLTVAASIRRQTAPVRDGLRGPGELGPS